jgi:SAM-dependent methyltransferase
MFMVAKGLRALVPVPVKRTLRRTVAWIRIPQARLRLAFGVTPLNAPWVHRRGGLQVHRYYVEAFLGEFAADIHGHCLEFQDGHYATRFGGKQVTKLDILHKEAGNPRATLVADLTQPHAIPENLFECIICTHVLHVIRDVDRFVTALQRLLAPGGVLLLAVPHISPIYPRAHELWRFTPEGLAVVLAKVFPVAQITIRSYGNSLTASGDLRGLVAHEFAKRELQYADESFAVEVCARARKEC